MVYAAHKSSIFFELAYRFAAVIYVTNQPYYRGISVHLSVCTYYTDLMSISCFDFWVMCQKIA